MVSKYTQNLIDVVEEEARVNRPTAMPFIRPDFLSRWRNVSWKSTGGDWL
jgi:hypothetical protein